MEVSSATVKKDMRKTMKENAKVCQILLDILCTCVISENFIICYSQYNGTSSRFFSEIIIGCSYQFHLEDGIVLFAQCLCT